MDRFLKFFAVSWLLTVSALCAPGLTLLKNVPSTYVYPPSGFLPFNIHRGTQSMLTLMLRGVTFENPQGLACALLKSDQDPRNPKQDILVTVVGVNSGAGELIYNVGLKAIKRYGTQGRGKGQFLNPIGVAIDPEGDVAVADTGNQRIVLLKDDGFRLRWVRAFGRKGKEVGEFENPLAVAYDSQDNLYIADAGNNRIQILNPRGEFHVLPVQGLDAPCALAVIDWKEPWSFYRQGIYANRLAVIDRMGNRVQTFTLLGQPLAQFTEDQVVDPPMQLTSCAFDYYGNLIATDLAKCCLRKFDRNLYPIVSFGGPGEDDFEFNEPRGIAFNREFGQMFISEKDSVQYFWNGADALNLKIHQEKNMEQVHFFLTERSLVSASIQTLNGTLIQSLAKASDLEVGPQELDWIPDHPISPGNYQIQLKVMATYSSRERIAKQITEIFPYQEPPAVAQGQRAAP